MSNDRLLLPVADVVVTVPARQWASWLAEGDLPGDPPTGQRSHFWLRRLPLKAAPGSRVYVVSGGKLRGYAPLVGLEYRCALRPDRGCLLRTDGAVAVTIDEQITGFRGFRYRWWERSAEVPFPDWR